MIYTEYKKYIVPLVFTLLGIISGLISGRLFEGFDRKFLIYFYSPAISFAIAIYLAFLITRKSVPVGLVILWFLSTILAYVLAINVLFGTFITSGLVGALVVALGYNFSLSKLTLFQIGILAVLGGILASVGLRGENFDILFIVWQTGIAAVLGLFTQLSSKEQVNKSSIDVSPGS